MDVRETDREIIALTANGEVFGQWQRDAYGRFDGEAHLERLSPALGVLNSPVTPPKFKAKPPVVGSALQLLIVDEKDHHFYTYPALIMAVGDAADCLDVIVELRFAPPHLTPADDWPKLIATADAVLLPGGGGTHQIEGQMHAAAAALDTNTPMLGICVGLQAMAVAIARKRCGMAHANHQELNPNSDPAIVSRVYDLAGEPEHRIGDKILRITPKSQVAAAYRHVVARERLHHSYRVSNVYAPDLAKAGFTATVFDPTREMIDAMELAGHPFFVGIQGHPEFSTQPGAPHPLMTALLKEAYGNRTNNTG